MDNLKVDFSDVNKILDDMVDTYKEDKVNHPSHYTFGKYEVIDIIKDQLSEDQFVGYCLGNAIKYISRCQHKGKMKEDIKKAIWYLNCIKD